MTRFLVSNFRFVFHDLSCLNEVPQLFENDSENSGIYLHGVITLLQLLNPDTSSLSDEFGALSDHH